MSTRTAWADAAGRWPAPFGPDVQLYHKIPTAFARGQAQPTSTKAGHLPGHPTVPLANDEGVTGILHEDLWADDLEQAAPRLWILATFSNGNISPLTRQRVKGRNILLTEEPRLHLVWIDNRVFVRPIPTYLFSHAFWTEYLDPGHPAATRETRHLRSAAIGLVRTYARLIRRESDFELAQNAQHRLLPEDISWEGFSRFICHFSRVPDRHVSRRYCYGELRLSRLNFYAPLLWSRAYYDQSHGQYSAYFERLFAPILFFFAVVSTALNSMQVELAVDQVNTSGDFSGLWPLFRALSLMFLLLAVLMGLLVSAIWTWMVVDEWIFALKVRFKRGSELRTWHAELLQARRNGGNARDSAVGLNRV